MIPRNVRKVMDMPGVETVAVIVLDAKSSLQNNKSLFARGFGLRQTLRMGLLTAWYSLRDKISSLPGLGSGSEHFSIRSAAKSRGVPFHVREEVSSESFVSFLRSFSPDLVVSFSAPCVFPEAVLKLPRHGCINLHCSMLPQFAGVMPSFWTLYKGVSSTGATVHYMDTRIDNGSILAQRAVALEPGMSILDVIRKTKAVGGDLVCDAISEIMEGRASPRPNDVSKGSYYGWPTLEDLRQFRRNGGRLI